MLTLYRETGSGTREIVARNDNYDGRDSFIGLQLDTGTYYIAVTSTGNTAINPEVSDSGYGGRSDGDYQLKLGFVPTATAANTIVDTSGTLLDGDRDGKAGGAFRFWFNTASVANTLFVDKATATAVGADGTVAKPYKTVRAALAAVVPTTRLIRIVGNAAGSGGTSLPYLIGTDLAGRTLSDGGTFNVPAGVTVMIDEGAVLKLRAAVIDVGSSSPLVSRAGAALQVLGTPTNNVLFTSYHDDTVGGNSDGIGPAATGGQWGGIALRSNSDSATKKVFLNSISQSQISYGGGQVSVDSQLQVVSPIQLESTRPTLAFNTITKSSGAAISADPNSFEDSDGRSGPELRGNRLLNNSINGLFVRIRTEFGSPVDKLDVSARFKSTDIVYVLQENLFINGGVGGYEKKVDPADGVLKYFARKSGRLTVDPGVVVKLQGSRIELERGTSQLIAEGTADRPVIFTSLGDNRFGGGGTFDTNGALSDVSVAGDWGGIFLNAGSSASIDRATIAYGGGQTPIEGTFDSFNVIETHQGDLRVAHSRIENNAAGASSTNRVGRGGNAAATIFVRGAQPIIVSNDFRNNLGAVVSVNANSLTDVERPDSGRITGAIDREPLYDDNVGPLVRGNRLSYSAGVSAGGSMSGMQVRGEEITVQSVWDDADIVHVLQSEIIVQNFHTATGIRLQSQPNASLIVKLDGPNAGFTAAGYGLDINDRIGGTVQVVGQPGYPVVLTSLKDDSVGASLDPLGLLVKDTNNDGTATVPAAGDWRSLKFLPLSNDRNVSIVLESEKVVTGGVDVNGTALLAQSLGVLAPNFATGGASTASAQEKGGDDNRRLGFEVHGRIASDTPSDVDVYSFVGYSGSEAWIDIDKTSPSLNAMVELLDASGTVLALSADSLSDATLTSLTKGIGLPLAKDSILGADFYSQNPKDPGMRVVLPILAGQPIGTLTQYYIRVRSQPKYDATTTQPQYETDLRDSAKVGAGESAGQYELRVRLQQRDEVPGSTVRYADIRYPTIGIDVLGLPSRSPLTGENGENSTDANNAFASAQYVGNLLQADQNTISIAGAIAGASDVDWYTFALNFEQIQSIGGVNNGGKTWATVFDIDYGDGFRGDLTLSVFDSTGRLMYVGRDSNVAADQPAVSQGNNFNDLSRGSLGKLDPFIGSVQMPAGNPTGSGSIEDGAAAVAPDPSKQLRYYVAVSSNEQLPSALDATFKASATNSLIRLEPVNSVTRVVEDHIGFTGYHSGESVTGVDSNDYTLVSPSGGPMFDLPNLKNQISPFTFNDVGVYLSSSSKITPGANDLMMRSDGKLYSYTGLSGAANTAGRLDVMDLGTGLTTLVGNDSIPDRPASTTVTETRLVPPILPPITATTSFGLANTNIILSTFTGVLQYTTTLPGDTTPTTGTWTITSDALGSLTFTPFGGVINLMPQPGPNSTVAGGGAVQVNWTANGGVGQVVALGVELVTVTYTFTPDPNSITTDLVDALAWHRVAGAAPVFDQLFYSVRDGNQSRLYLANTANGSAATGRRGVAGSVETSFIQTQNNILGITTGMAFVGDTLYGVDNLGHLFTIDRDTAVATLVRAVTGSPNFQGLTIGPQNVAGGPSNLPGYFADKLFAIDQNGFLRAYDTLGNLLTVFDTDSDGTPDSTSRFYGEGTAASPIPGNFTGFAFSPLDINLWHATNNRASDPGHGVTVALDHTRDGLFDSWPAGKGQKENVGGASIYYGLDPSKGGAMDGTQIGHLGVVSPTWLGDLVSGFGGLRADLPFNGSNQTLSSDTTGSSTSVHVASTANLRVGMEVTGAGIPSGTTILSIDSATYVSLSNPASASGLAVPLTFASLGVVITTKSFSLAGYDYTDQPTLYFNYFIGAGAGSTNVRLLAGSQSITIATNDHSRSLLDTTSETLPNFTSVSSAIGGQPNQLVQELFEDTGWRQVRIDIGQFAGNPNIILQFSFNPSVSSVTGKCEGVYFDDIVVGFAERGEMVTGAAAAQTGYFTVGTPSSSTTAEQNLQGPYQLEIRRGEEYGTLTRKYSAGVQIDQTFGANDSLTQDSGRLGDANQLRQQGQFLIESNIVSNALTYGISIDSGVRDPGTNAPSPGVLRSLPVLSVSRLVPGVVVANNVIADSGTAGILFSGDPNTGSGPIAAVPYGRIINNTIYGRETVTATGDTLAASPVITLASTASLRSGMLVFGSGIPANTAILSIDSATTLTLTQNALATAVGVVLTFSPGMVGVQVTENAGPTLLNNLFANLAKGVDVDGTSRLDLAGNQRTVVGTSAYFGTLTQVSGVTQSQQILLSTNPFVNATKNNFYLVQGSRAIDSAMNSLGDRNEFVVVNSPLGIPQSPILAPQRDLYGQLRGDDPGEVGLPGLGSNVYLDRGAIDRVDLAQPTISLAVPLDQSASTPVDRDPASNSVTLTQADAQGVTRFVLQLNDNGVGIDKSTVTSAAFTLKRDGVLLVAGTDYLFRYLENTNSVVLESASVYAFGTYVIDVATAASTNGATGMMTDLANNTLLPNDPALGTTVFTISLADVPAAPTGLTGVIGDGQIAISWIAPAANGSPITDYVIEYRTNVVGSLWSLFSHATSTATAATVPGLTNGTGYLFRVAAVSAVGTGEYSAESAAFTPLAPASAPTSVVGVSGNAQVSLTWVTPPSDGGSPISDYVVQYSSDGVSWTPFAHAVSTATSATVTGLTNGISYVFRTAAVTDGGTGAFSVPSSSVMPVGVAGAVTGLAGTAGNGQVTLSWAPPLSNGGSAITDYVIQRSSDAGVTWTPFVHAASTATSATVTGLTNGTGYLFQVATVNGTGTGAYAQSTVLTPRTVAGAVTGLAGTAGNGQVTLSWTAPTSTGGNAITDYLVQQSSDAGVTWTTFTDAVSTATSATVTGLINGTSYLFEVAAANSAGLGTYTRSTSVTPRTVAGTVTGLAGTVGNGLVTLSWVAPISNGGSAITDYVIQRSSNAGITWTTFTDGVSTATSAAVTGLINGTSYMFQVATVNGVGAGIYAQSTVLTPRGMPGPVTGLAVTAGNGQVSLSWTAPLSNGGSAITDYVIQQSTDAGVTWTTFADAISTATRATVTGLTNGTSYLFGVAAVNAAVTGTYTRSASVTPRTVAGSVTDLAGTAGNGQVSLSWTAPTSTGGGAISDYRIRQSSNAGATWITFRDAISTATSATVTGLTNGASYLFQVAAVNGAGAGTYARSASVTPRTVAGAVTGLARTAGNGQVSLSWKAPTSTGGSAITDYVIRRSSDAGATWTTFIDAVSTATSATVTGLTNGTSYMFQVAAVNGAGTGTYARSASIAPRTVADAVTGLAGTAGNGLVTLSWLAPISNGGSAITDYVIQQSTNAGVTWTTLRDAISTATSATVTGLTNGTGYLFQVAAVNGAGTGTYARSTVLTPVTAPTVAPTTVTGIGGLGVVTLNWVTPTASLASPVTGYVIQYRRSNLPTAAWVTYGVSATSTATISGLTSRLGYVFRVAATNGSGTGPYSAQSASIDPFAV